MQEEEEKKDKEASEFLMKILVVGDPGVGKTSLIKRYVHNMFSAHYKATIGVDFALKTIRLDEGKTIARVQLWDIAGQERFGNMTRVYYREAVGALIVCDVTRIASFEAAAKWKEDIRVKLEPPPGHSDPFPVVLVLNKMDLPQESHSKDILALLDEIVARDKYIGCVRVSAKDGSGVMEGVDSLVRHILNCDPEYLKASDKDTLNLSQGTSEKKGCCN